MKVLVTGAAGFIGSHFTEKLAELGHIVYGIDNLSDYYDVQLKQLNIQDIKAKGVHFIETCLTKSFEAELSNDFDYIVHFAAQPGISDTTPFAAYVKNNIQATERLLHWAKTLDHLKLFVNISTSSVYGAQATSTEDEAPRPISNYGVTKLAAEQLILSQQRLGVIKACSIRLFSVYGPRERPEKLYTKLIKAILEENTFPLYEGSEKHERSFTYVGDIVDGLLKVLELPDLCNGQLINMGNEAVYTTGQGIAIIESILEKKALLQIVPKRSGDQIRTSANIDKARDLLSYQPSTTFEDGLRSQVAWYLGKFVN